MYLDDNKALIRMVNHTCKYEPYSLIKLQWSSIKYACTQLRRKPQYIDLVCENMMPVYRRLLMADPCFFQNKHWDTPILRNILLIMEEEKWIGAKLSDLNLIECANHWAERLKADNHSPWLFHILLRTLFASGYSRDWEGLRQNLYGLLRQGTQCVDHKQHEMYSIVMAYLQIYSHACTVDQKRILYFQLMHEWDFLRYLYSILLGYMVGLGFENFAGLAYSLRQKKNHRGYLYLAYQAFQVNLDKLCPPNLRDFRTHQPIRDMAQVHLDLMANIIKQTPKKRDLELLCGILFPKKMQEVLDQDCPETYTELQEMVGQDQEEIQHLCDLVGKSISEKDMLQAFDRFPPETGLKYFDKVNSTLAANPKWQRMSTAIQEHIFAKLNSSNVFIQNQMAPVYGNVGQQSIRIGSAANGESN